MFKFVMVAAFAGFGLAGCVTDPNGQIGTAVLQAQKMAEQTVTAICQNEPTAYGAYQALALVHPVKAKVAAKIESAHAAIAGVCADLSGGKQINFLTAAIAAVDAYAAIKAAAGTKT